MRKSYYMKGLFLNLVYDLRGINDLIYKEKVIHKYFDTHPFFFRKIVILCYKISKSKRQKTSSPPQKKKIYTVSRKQGSYSGYLPNSDPGQQLMDKTTFFFFSFSYCIFQTEMNIKSKFYMQVTYSITLTLKENYKILTNRDGDLLKTWFYIDQVRFLAF